MIATIIVISYLAGLGALVDQIRRPASQWVAADRNRGAWISATVLCGFPACGLLVALVYLMGVLPRFSADDRVDAAFRKSS